MASAPSAAACGSCSRRSSISRTDFWGNVVARERNGCYELAYGHHRIEAARRALGKAASVPIIVLELDDAYMLQMMAADNDDAYAIMPGFILEVVRAAKSFVENGSTVGTGPHRCGVQKLRNDLDRKGV